MASTRQTSASCKGPDKYQHKLPSKVCINEVALLGDAHVYIGRGDPRGGLPESKWANPFRVARLGRSAATHQFEQHLLGDEHLLHDLIELNGKVLVCHCRAGQQCHADIIIKVAASRLLPPAQGRERARSVSARPPDTHVNPTMGEKAVCVEVLAGSAGIAAALASAGLPSTAIDWSGNRHKPKVPVRQLDLTTHEGATELENIIARPSVKFVWFAPPCGTFSRAREMPVPQRLVEQGAPQPKPLRDAVFPLGFPGLGRNDRVKVAKGNILARITAEQALAHLKRGAKFAIENQENS